MVQYVPNTSSCGYTDRIISMTIGVAFSFGDVSMRIRPSIGLVVPVWAVMSSSAGSDIGTVLLVSQIDRIWLQHCNCSRELGQKMVRTAGFRRRNIQY